MYIDYGDYLAYRGEAIPEEEFDRYAARACEAIDDATMGRLQGGAWERLGDIDRSRVRLACCAQMEYLYFMGVEAALGASDVSSFMLGKTQVSLGRAKASPPGLCAKARAALMPTGLLYRGVSACGL